MPPKKPGSAESTPPSVIAIEEGGEKQQKPCKHHWVIQPASGPVSDGECQRCGETREFKNYVEGRDWNDHGLANPTQEAGGDGESEVLIRPEDLVDPKLEDPD